MPKPSSTLARFLEPLASGLWIAFLVWTVLTAIVWGFGIGEAETGNWLRLRFPGAETGMVGRQTPLGSALAMLLTAIDPVWLALAAGNCYAGLAATEGLARARRWSLLVIGTALILGACSVGTGWPFGPLRFTSRLGPQVAGVSLGVLMLWCVVVFGGREVSRRLLPRASHAAVALGTGVLAAVTAWNLEPAASGQRVWWLWPGDTHAWRLIGTWLVAGTGLAWSFRSRGVSGRAEGGRAAGALALLNGLALLARLGDVLHR